MFGDYVSSSDVSMESVQDEETHSELTPEVDNIGEDIEADQNKQFRCDQCHRYFMFKEHLDTHENVAHCMGKEEETVSRPSSPLQPNDVQKEPSNVQKVEEGSDNDNSYSCDMCDTSFSLKTDMLIHKKTKHNIYQCEICGRTFKKKGNLNRHINSVHKQITYQCDEC